MNLQPAWSHIDMDGLESIYEAHQQSPPSKELADQWFLSAVENAASFFMSAGIKATFFVVGRDLEDANRAKAITNLVEQGHHIASHTVTHCALSNSDTATKRQEIKDSKSLLENRLGVTVSGFRAPGYHIDGESLDFLSKEGYIYDSSLFPGSKRTLEIGLAELGQDPQPIEIYRGLVELPLPVGFRWSPPFHPCYAFIFGKMYHAISIKKYAERSAPLTYLFHLTDFADLISFQQTAKMRILTNNGKDWQKKRPVLDTLINTVQNYFYFTTSEEFICNLDTRI